MSKSSQALLLLFIVVVLCIASQNNKSVSSSRPTTASTPTLHRDAGYSVVGEPTISPTFINTILCHWQSPTCGMGQQMYNLGVQYRIDPAYALAFFMNESTFGTAGMARLTLGLGNERCIDDRPCINSLGDECQAGQSCYAKFYSWEDGFEHWYSLILHLYIEQWGLTTIPQIIHRYAPNADNNNEAHYIWVVEHAVDLWRDGKVALS